MMPLHVGSLKSIQIDHIFQEVVDASQIYFIDYAQNLKVFFKN